MREAVEAQIERESRALFDSGRGYDDGDHRPARHPHGARHRAVAPCTTRAVEGADGFGVFRM